MPFVRFSRDKRGYEHVYLFHTPSTPRSAARPQMLYWYRTPPGVRVGRVPFDDDVRKALEAQYPDVHFEWAKIAQAQPPPPQETEPWRERRRAERSAKQARIERGDAVPAVEIQAVASTAAAASTESQTPAAGGRDSAEPGNAHAAALSDRARSRRRRRGGRRQRRDGEPQPSANAGAPEPADDRQSINPEPEAGDGPEPS